jgi:phosphatidate phosphatase APP1
MTSLSNISVPSYLSGLLGTGLHHNQENECDKATRETGHFADFEKTMPLLPNRFSGSMIERITSYLGSRNPFTSQVKEGEQSVWLFDTAAWRPTDSQGQRTDVWKVNIVAAYFHKNSGHGQSVVVADISEKLGVGEGDEAEARIAERLQPFLDSVCPSKTIRIKVESKGGSTQLGPSNNFGISNNTITLRGSHADGEVVYGSAGMKGVTPLSITFAEPTGWAVISDIDDTIKKTLTSTPIGILQTTFADIPEPIQGMPEFYSYLTKQLDNPPFWYVSASPYNLYPFLRNFREQHYPPGSIYLREASWMTLAGLFTNLTLGTQAYKVGRFKTIYDSYPGRKFICIGDSTQSDPEAYSEMYRDHPDWIKAIFIRKVTGVSEMDSTEKNSDERFQKAFDGVPKSVWHVFEDPAELYDRVEELTKA